MSGLQWVIGGFGTILNLVLFLIVVRRRHYRQLPFFTLYVAGLSATGVAMSLAYAYGGRRQIWDVWLAQQIGIAALRFGVALELTQVIFGAFRAAAITARRVVLALLVVTAFAAMSAPGSDGSYMQFNGTMVPRLATGAVWIFTALAALVLWYRLPLGELPKAILMGYAPYLLIFTVAMNLLTSIGWHLRSWVGYVDTLSFVALVLYWSRVAWRTAPETAPPDGGAPPVTSRELAGTSPAEGRT